MKSLGLIPHGGCGTDSRDIVKEQLPTLLLFGVLFSLASALLPSVPIAVCFEGGVYRGFPFSFYYQCSGGIVPGDGSPLGPPDLNLLALVLDGVVWYLVSFGVVRLVRLLRRL